MSVAVHLKVQNFRRHTIFCKDDGSPYSGIISEVTQRGIFVELKNTAEGFVPIESFGGNYRFDGIVSHVDENTGKKLTIGMSVKIKVAAADVAFGRIDFDYVGDSDK